MSIMNWAMVRTLTKHSEPVGLIKIMAGFHEFGRGFPKS